MNLCIVLKGVIFKCRPRWNEHVADMHDIARDAFLMWKDQGKPRQGPVFEMKKRTNARFKYALRYIKKP